MWKTDTNQTSLWLIVSMKWENACMNGWVVPRSNKNTVKVTVLLYVNISIWELSLLDPALQLDT